MFICFTVVPLVEHAKIGCLGLYLEMKLDILPFSVMQINMSTFSFGSNAIAQPVFVNRSRLSALFPCCLILFLILMNYCS